MKGNEIINWDDFQSKFYKIEPGQQAELVFINWRQRERAFKEGEAPRTTLCFDVVNAEGKELIPAKEWSTTSPSLASEFRPMIEQAIKAGRIYLKVILKRTDNKRYIAVDISERDQQPEKVYQGLKK